MYKLNHIQYPNPPQFNIEENYSLEALKTNFDFDKCKRNFKTKFNYEELNTFSFSQDGFIAMMMKLRGKIAVGLGESQAIVSAAHACEDFGADITFIGLNQDGTLNVEALKNKKFDYVFISSYVMDTFVKTNLKEVKKLSKAKLISNVSASFEYMEMIDVALFDIYKLTGYQTHSVALHNGLLDEQFLSQYDYVSMSILYDAINNESTKIRMKKAFIEILKEELEGNMFFFVDNSKTLENTLHLGLKGIKAREIIRTLALGSIFITNGEGCSLGLARPSKIIQAMGYSEEESRQAISLSFDENLSKEDMKTIAKAIAKNYRQIIRLSF